MPARKNKKENKRDEGRYFHIYNRGVEKRIIFGDKEDHQVFVGYLRGYLTIPANAESTKKTFTVNGRTFKGVPHQPKNYFDKIELIAYSLMSNHFHLLLHQKSPGSMERFMRSLSTRYSMYFNKKYQRKGSLFQGPYKSAKIDDVQHLAYLSRHIHNHPKKNRLNLKYSHSSYKAYLGLRETAWVKPEVAMSAFKRLDNEFAKQVNGYKSFVEKYKLGKEEAKQLESILLESESEHLERRNPPLERSVSPKVVPTPKTKPRTKVTESLGVKPISNIEPDFKARFRIPELIAATSLFVLLLGLGISNIQASASKIAIATPSPTPAVAALEDEKVESVPATKKVVVIEITDGAASVNLRQGPSTRTASVGKALEDDVFNFISEESGWYEFQFDNDSTAFVSTQYAKTIDVKIEGN